MKNQDYHLKYKKEVLVVMEKYLHPLIAETKNTLHNYKHNFKIYKIHNSTYSSKPYIFFRITKLLNIFIQMLKNCLVIK